MYKQKERWLDNIYKCYPTKDRECWSKIEHEKDGSGENVRVKWVRDHESSSTFPLSFYKGGERGFSLSPLVGLAFTKKLSKDYNWAVHIRSQALGYVIRAQTHQWGP